MSVQLLKRPEPVALPKPKPGARCNGCGECCIASPCHLAIGVLKAMPGVMCPALEREGVHFVCGLVRNPQAYDPVRVAIFGLEETQDAAVLLVGAGNCCDSWRPDDTDDEIAAMEILCGSFRNAHAGEIVEAGIIWGLWDEDTWQEEPRG